MDHKEELLPEKLQDAADDARDGTTARCLLDAEMPQETRSKELVPCPELAPIEELDRVAVIYYPDGGLQAWSVVAGGFFMVFCVFGMTGAYGAYNTYYHNTILADYPLSSTAWIGSLQCFLVFFLAAFGGALFDRYGPLPLMLFGTIFSVGGHIALSFCNKLWQFFVVQSIVLGFGMGAMFVCGVGAVAEWFKEKKGLATGVVVAGSSLGSIVWPLLINYLPDRVGFPWTVRIIGLIELFCLSLATILIRTRLPRPPPKKLFRWEAFFSLPAYACMALSTFFFGFGFFFFLYFCGQYALQIGGGSRAPYVLIACNAASAIGRIFSGVVADRYGYYNVMIVETGLSAALIFLWLGVDSIGPLFVIAISYGIMTGGNIALQGVCVMQVTSSIGYTGTMIGQLYAAESFSLLLGPPIAGYILGTTADTQMKNFKYAIILNGGFLALATTFAVAARCIQNKRLKAVC